ncbi:putative quinol monooxygenase [Ulvibacterium sp.]|uniref:putative quinol monooxygenase n=1 Tax=Ulvibacterium sp. TaxID=2665914 RepID=UPI002606A2D8|nr:putative quinol monooxygenase [Ulvibacterium sp.]
MSFLEAMEYGYTNQKYYPTHTKEKKKLTVVVRVFAKANGRGLIKSELTKLIESMGKEKGCISCNLYQDSQNDNLFLLIENWENKDLWQKHMNNKHMKSYMKATSGAIKEFTINELFHIV